LNNTGPTKYIINKVDYNIKTIKNIKIKVNIVIVNSIYNNPKNIIFIVSIVIS